MFLQKTINQKIFQFIFSLVICLYLPICAAATPATSSCQRYPAGSTISNPVNLYSQNGTLTVNFSYQTAKDSQGRTTYCFVDSNGNENPTLQVQPGDTLILNITNNLPAGTATSMVMPNVCPGSSGNLITTTSFNIHLHGLNISPACNQDDVVNTLINSGTTFQYKITIPKDDPPGMYWYHPHIHGSTEKTVQGGASGAIIVAGLEKFQPSVLSLNERVLMIRDQLVVNPNGLPKPPLLELTLNNTPISFPSYTPATIQMQAGNKEIWKVANAAADSSVDLQVIYDGVPQNLQIVALDGVPTGSQNGTTLSATSLFANHIRLVSGNRAEFLVTPPNPNVKSAVLVSNKINNGSGGITGNKVTLANIQISNTFNAQQIFPIRVADQLPFIKRFESVSSAVLNKQRTLIFSELPAAGPKYFVSLKGTNPQVFSYANPPSITTTQGATEEWTIVNQSTETHVFHIHQVHFLVMSQNNFIVNGSNLNNVTGQYLDTIEIPYWNGNPNTPYPSVTLKMSFENVDVGTFVYHCHVLFHEDHGMMAAIQVNPPSP